MLIGPQTEFSDQLHADKYRGEGEDFREAQNRVASSLSDNSEHFRELRDIFLRMAFLAAGRVQAAMGSTRQITPYNCFVSGTIEDSFVDGHGSIMGRAHEAATTMRMGGGIGYDFSTLRPRGAMVKKLRSNSSGPVSFMDIFDSVCRCVASSGHRRGAQMGVLRIDHPDIEEFVRAKQNDNRLTGFNISIGVTDEFMQAVENDRPFALRFQGEVYREVNARALWETIMRSTWDWAEPGVLFVDRINEMNNLWYCETISATNPCGEQPLPPYGACLLGSFNLTKYIVKLDEGRFAFDWHSFRRDIPIVVRGMDNVVDRATYPLFEQEKEAKSKRRMGLGVTGVANALEAIGLPYGSSEFLTQFDLILQCLTTEAYKASVELAIEKGSFPLFDQEQYCKSKFVQHLPKWLQERIRRYGIRNSHLISIAPTGTISMCADNVSSGIEPVFCYSQERDIRGPEGDVTVRVEDFAFSHWGVRGRQAKDVTIEEHLGVLKTAFKWVDSSVSKTLNVPVDTPWEDFKNIYFEAWKGGCKGCTTFQVGGKRFGVLREAEEIPGQKEAAACYIDPETGRKECE